MASCSSCSRLVHKFKLIFGCKEERPNYSGVHSRKLNAHVKKSGDEDSGAGIAALKSPQRLGESYS